MITFLWILCGLLSAIILAWMNECHKTKTISSNQIIGFIVVFAMGCVGFLVIAVVLGVAYLSHWCAEKGSDPLIKWGKTDGQ